jgi:CheY-like chemotaxis protein
VELLSSVFISPQLLPNTTGLYTLGRLHHLTVQLTTKGTIMSVASATTTHLHQADTTGDHQSTVLLIDDNCELCALMREILEMEDYVVTSVPNKDELAAVLKQNRYDMIICDLHLGHEDGPNGLALLQGLSAHGLLSRGLLITGDPRGIDEAHLPDNCGLLLKPFRAGDLLDAIQVR